MTTPADRLKAARIKAGYSSATEAAKAFGWTVSSYLGHENGSRGLQIDAAQRYGRAFRVHWGQLMTGQDGPVENREFGVPVVGVLGFTSGKLAEPSQSTTIIPVGAEGYGFDELIAVVVRPGETVEYLIVCTDPKQPLLYGDEMLCSVATDGGRYYGTFVVSGGPDGGALGERGDRFVLHRGFPRDEFEVVYDEASFRDLDSIRFEGIVVATYQDLGRRRAIESQALRNMR